MNVKPVWIDTDIGVDDAIALITALSLKEMEVVGVSAVCGNTLEENAFRNARNVLSLCGHKDVPVYSGAKKPLVIELFTAAYVHGKNGLGGAEIPESDAKIRQEKAWDALYEKAKELKGELTLITIGPLTNLAIAISKHPDIVSYIKELNMMGGSLIGGNVTPAAEFNIYVDPQAAECVFRSGIRINMFGLDVTHKAYLNDEDIAEIMAMDNPLAKLFHDSNDLLSEYRNRANWDGLCEHDSCPVIYTAHPELFTGKECGIYVETEGKLTFGKTITDLWSDHKFADRHCTAFLEVDREEFVRIIKNAYRGYEGGSR